MTRLAVFVNVLCLAAIAQALIGNEHAVIAQLAQQPARTTQNPTPAAIDRLRTRAEELERQAFDLSLQRNEESQRQAIAKYEAALKIWQEIGDRSREAYVLEFIARSYDNLEQPQKAQDAYNQALAIRNQLTVIQETGQSSSPITFNPMSCDWQMRKTSKPPLIRSIV